VRRNRNRLRLAYVVSIEISPRYIRGPWPGGCSSPLTTRDHTQSQRSIFRYRIRPEQREHDLLPSTDSAASGLRLRLAVLVGRASSPMSSVAVFRTNGLDGPSRSRRCGLLDDPTTDDGSVSRARARLNQCARGQLIARLLCIAAIAEALGCRGQRVEVAGRLWRRRSGRTAPSEQVSSLQSDPPLRFASPREPRRILRPRRRRKLGLASSGVDSRRSALDMLRN
jgi:hypothetical protein